ncbi:uroporphyrinogen-III C-methyltransferase [Iodidimonas sp. SYSU 1G8]|uniref:uroporphyrinogen-III C-methyltransferase n=1 Tax=Iodidimonas sp. SYSU 1G8 TaxID=3133967 RepID=UPI0031FE4B12
MAGESRVYLVGAGPGDPDLITVKALRVLRAADAVVYDRLVSDEILSEIPAHAVRVYVGKEGGTHSLPQSEISQLLVTLARQGKTVVRLKGGDPYIFGRGGEEALVLAEASVPFEVVPGITAASGVLAGLGVPLTHRGLANGVRFVTGQCGKNVPLDLNWASLADPDTTLVVYMGLAKLPEISANLIAAGMPADQPAMAVSKGTLEDETVVLGTIESLPARVREVHLAPPVLILIGRVVSLRETLGRDPAPRT